VREPTGQLVTEGGHEVTVYTVVRYTVLVAYSPGVEIATAGLETLSTTLGAGLDDLADPVSSAVIEQTVVVTAMVSVTTTVDSAGQLVTVEAHEVMVRVVVE